MAIPHYIRLKHGVKSYRLRIEEVYHSDQVIRYKVSGRDRSVILQTNEPFFRNRGMKHRRPDWKLWEGQIREAGFVALLIRTLENLRREKNIEQ